MTTHAAPPPAPSPNRIGACRVLRNVTSLPGVETVEGRLVPLMGGNAIRSHMIVMHPGQYCFPHPHPTESLIYTISGRWVFCTTEDEVEVRTVIAAGDLFHMAPDVATGFETPFDEAAEILILKGEPGDHATMKQAMTDTKASLDQAAADGEPFTLAALPDDHPARQFAVSLSTPATSSD